MENGYPMHQSRRTDMISCNALFCRLSRLDCPSVNLGKTHQTPAIGDRVMEFHIHAGIRALLGTSASLFRTTGNLIIPDFHSARVLADKMRSCGTIQKQDVSGTSAGRLNAMALIDEILHIVLNSYREKAKPDAIRQFEAAVIRRIGISGYDALLEEFGKEFPPRDVYQGSTDYENWLASSSPLSPTGGKISNRELALEELILLKLANENPAFAPFRVLFNDGNRAGGADPDSLSANTLYLQAFAAIEDVSRTMPVFGPEGEKNDIIGLLRMPALMAPDSLAEQLKWIRDNWGATFDSINLDILQSLDLIKEEEAPRFGPGTGP
ncbi:MAG: hypothetical protein LLF89_00540, partial [Spirochaetaceae bacterium]|nr:hypothetical protein [Spirochaetaceae bacterium]